MVNTCPSPSSNTVGRRIEKPVLSEPPREDCRSITRRIYESKIQNVYFRYILAGVLITPASAWARDYWHWSRDNNRWDRRAELRSDYRDLEEARRQLEYDRRHHASRKKLAQDEERIRDIERDIRAYRSARR